MFSEQFKKLFSGQLVYFSLIPLRSQLTSLITLISCLNCDRPFTEPFRCLFNLKAEISCVRSHNFRYYSCWRTLNKAVIVCAVPILIDTSRVPAITKSYRYNIPVWHESVVTDTLSCRGKSLHVQRTCSPIL